MNSIFTEKEEQNRIWEIRHQMAIERFSSYDEYMEIPGYNNSYDDIESDSEPESELSIYRNNLEKRFNACKYRYAGIEEYLEIPDMDLWLKLKEEIIEKTRAKFLFLMHNGKEIMVSYSQLSIWVSEEENSASN